MKRSLSKIREWSLEIKIFSFVCFSLCFSVLSFADVLTSKKTVISGEEMEIRHYGDITVSRGNSKAVSGKNTITADKMTYNKKEETVDASGNVKLFSFTDDGEPVKAYGEFALYNMPLGKGRLWGKNTFAEYFMKDSQKPLFLKAEEIEFDRNLETLSARHNVEIAASSGTIVSDNAVYDRKTASVVMVKDKRRPLADVYYDGRSGVYEADKMVFYNSATNKKIVMSGQVCGNVEMEDEIK